MKPDRNRWHHDPVAFILEALRDPETGKPFELYPEEIAFIRWAFTLLANGRLPFAEILFSAPKKSGKTALAAMLVLYVIIVLGGNYAEAYIIANDFEQAASRVFEAISRIIKASPLLKNSAKITANKIEFTSTGATITALASEYAGAAGANPTITVFDELWGYVSERAQRLWDEMVPVPTRKVSVRLTVTYAGFTGESTLLEGLYKRAMAGEQVAPDLYRNGSMLAYWTHQCHAPWQDEDWRQQMREQLRTNAYLRLIENQWVTSESSFVEMPWWDACVNSDLTPVISDPTLPVWIGVDASTKRDSTAIVLCTFADGKVKLIQHYTWQPSPQDPLDFEQTIEKTLLYLRRQFYIREVRFDPFQMQSSAQRLTLQGLPMIEYAQSVPALTESSSNLYELIKGRNLVVYPNAEMRLAISRAVALETSRGWRIAKEKQSHRVDVIVALAMAALGAVQQGQATPEYSYQSVTGRDFGGSQSRLQIRDGAYQYSVGERCDVRDAQEDLVRTGSGFGAVMGAARFSRRGAW